MVLSLLCSSDVDFCLALWFFPSRWHALACRAGWAVCSWCPPTILEEAGSSSFKDWAMAGSTPLVTARFSDLWHPHSRLRATFAYAPWEMLPNRPALFALASSWNIFINTSSWVVGTRSWHCPACCYQTCFPDAISSHDSYCVQFLI